MIAQLLVALLVVMAVCLGRTSALFAVGSHLTGVTNTAQTWNTLAVSHSNKNHHPNNPYRFSPSNLSSDNNNNNNNDNSVEREEEHKEETLLRLRLLVQDGVDVDQALAAVQSYTQSFPFAIILPVQPMQYLPTLQGGVDVLFLRKKTPEKGSVDGGLRIEIFSNDRDEIEISVTRNAQGQVVSKVFSEKLIVQALVKAFSNDFDERIPAAAPTNLVTVKSVFHKWLDTNPPVTRK
jgi:hypothetical protein